MKGGTNHMIVYHSAPNAVLYISQKVLPLSVQLIKTDNTGLCCYCG